MSANDPITTSVAHRDGIAVVTVGGEIDSFTAPALEAAIAEALAVDPTALIIELSTVTFLASRACRSWRQPTQSQQIGSLHGRGKGSGYE